MDHVKDHPSVIGYQLDNETKAYDTSGPNVQAAFVKSLRQRYPDLAAMNKEFGLDYWSNRVNDCCLLYTSCSRLASDLAIRKAPESRTTDKAI